jgi:phosphoribosylaminoimidazolecarboxamide formyltransferase/IMP cyclohydrolase
MPRALLSVSNKTGIADLGRNLAARGFELISTGGTARVLSEAGLAVTGVSDLTGFPEMMDGRVKTLHPALHGGILARRDHPGDLKALAEHGIGLIDLVVVNLYPFACTAANPSKSLADVVEMIDIGGPSMVRAAAKNWVHVGVVVDSADYPVVLSDLRADGFPSRSSRLSLAAKAFDHCARYDTAVAAYLTGVASAAAAAGERDRAVCARPGRARLQQEVRRRRRPARAAGGAAARGGRVPRGRG